MVWVKTHNGYFGQGNTTRLSSFKQINTDVDTFKLNSNAIILQKINGTLWVAGQNSYGSLGISNSARPVTTWTQMGSLSNNTIISYGVSNSASWVVYKHNTTGVYTVKASGLQANGNLGNNSTASSNVLLSTVTTLPVDSNIEFQSTSISYGGAVAKTNGKLYSCGINTYGRLGVGTTTESGSFVAPIDAPNINKVELFCAGECFTAYMDNEGYVYVSGYYPEKSGTATGTYTTKFVKYQIPSRS